MDVMEIIKIRRSIRQYENKSIPKDMLQNLVDAARFAPTARGVEPWEFIVITKQDTLNKIAKLADNGKFVAGAKACIAVFCADTKYYLEDGCAATQNILLAATAFSIASCWIAGDKKPYCQQISDLLSVPANFKLVSLISLGYPASKEDLVIKNKKALNEVIHWEKFE